MNLPQDGRPFATNVFEDCVQMSEYPCGLSFTEREVTFIIGHSLRKLYEDILGEGVPANLKSVIEKLDQK
jgi:hypothetical protein